MSALIVATQLELEGMPIERVAGILCDIVNGYGWAAMGFFKGANPYPSLLDSGIVFREHPAHGSGVEWFELPNVLLARGFGDCDGLTIYQLGWLRARGIQCMPTISDYSGVGSMHAQVRRLDTGKIEDWSMRLGAKTDWPLDFLYDRR